MSERICSDCYCCLNWDKGCAKGILAVHGERCYGLNPIPEPEPCEAETQRRGCGRMSKSTTTRRIEPCPYCGGDVRFDLGDLSAKCPSCFYTGPTDDNEAAAHNRLSRIVRAAEEWAKAEDEFDAAAKFGPVKRYEEAVDWANASYRALKDAVEGGRADG